MSDMAAGLVAVVVSWGARDSRQPGSLPVHSQFRSLRIPGVSRWHHSMLSRLVVCLLTSCDCSVVRN
jgi:hypothetical protein